MEHNKKEIKDYYSTAMSEMKKLRKDVNEILDKLEQDIVCEISKYRDDDTTNVIIAAGQCDMLMLKAKTTLTDIKESKRNGKLDHLYVEMKNAESNIPNMTEDVKSYIEKDLVTRYKFKRARTYAHRLTESELLIGRTTADKLKATHVTDLAIKSEYDTNDCLVSGIAVLQNSRVAVADSGNRCLKLIDAVGNKIVARISLSSKPFDLASVKKDQLAVSLSAVKRLAVYSVVHDMFTHPKYIELDRCLGMRHTGNKIVGIDQHPGTLKVYDVNGKISQTFDKDNNNENLFEMPRYIALSPDCELAYVTDWKTNSVACVTLGGEIISEYRDSSLRRPYGLAIDEAGVVYVSSTDSHSIHQLTPMCRGGRVILGTEDGLSPCPGCIAYCSDTGRLYTSSRSKLSGLKNSLKVFRLE